MIEMKINVRMKEVCLYLLDLFLTSYTQYLSWLADLANEKMAENLQRIQRY